MSAIANYQLLSHFYVIPNQQAPGEGFEPPRADAQTLSCNEISRRPP